MAISTRIQEGQRWRSLGDGHLLEVVKRASVGWIVRIQDSGVMTTMHESDLIDGDLYELAE